MVLESLHLNMFQLVDISSVPAGVMSLKQSLICSKSNPLRMVGNDFVCADQIPWMLLILNPQHLSYFGIQFSTTFLSSTVSVCHFRGRGSVIWLPPSVLFFWLKKIALENLHFLFCSLQYWVASAWINYNQKNVLYRFKLPLFIAWCGLGFGDRKLFHLI